MKNQNKNKSPEEKVIEIVYSSNVMFFLIDVKKENFFKSVEIIGKYNNFDCQLIKKNFKLIDLNYTDGNSLFFFEIGREFSPVIYITLNKVFNYYFDKNKEIKRMNKEDFKNLMYKFKEKTKAAEIDFEETEIFIRCRFWWD